MAMAYSKRIHLFQTNQVSNLISDIIKMIHRQNTTRVEAVEIAENLTRADISRPMKQPHQHPRYYLAFQEYLVWLTPSMHHSF